MKGDTKRQKVLRIVILLIMFAGVVFAVSEAIRNHDNGFSAYLPMLIMVPTAIYGITLFYPRKQK